MKKITLLLLLFWVFLFTGNAQQTLQNFSHEPYDSLLKIYVNENGMVDYEGIKNNPELLTTYINEIRELDSSNFEKWSRNQKMAFWINAYNAITIYGILENYPIDYGNIISRARFPKNSIRQIADFWDKVFVKVMDQKISLNDIEHEILRKQFDDPRIHAVLVCAALGCPPLDNRAFFPDNLDQRLEQANKEFINNPAHVRLDTTKNILHLNSIFDWYKEDYVASDTYIQRLNQYDKDIRGVIGFVLTYISPGDKEYILENRPDIEFLDYDWTLNEQ